MDQKENLVTLKDLILVLGREAEKKKMPTLIGIKTMGGGMIARPE